MVTSILSTSINLVSDRRRPSRTNVFGLYTRIGVEIVVQFGKVECMSFKQGGQE